MTLVSVISQDLLRIVVDKLLIVRALLAAESAGSPDDPEVRNDPAQLYGGVVFATNGMLFGLRPVAEAADRFVSERVGLDHLSFTVASRDALIAARDRLEERGVPHGEV